MLLCHFVKEPEDKKILEIGTGPGVIAIMLARRGAGHVTAVEIQDSLFAVAEANVNKLGLSDKITLIHKSVQDFVKSGPRLYDAIVCNPPYIRLGDGKLPPDREKAVARHELFLSANDVILMTPGLLKTTGSLYLIHRPERLADIQACVCNAGLHITRIRYVNGRPDSICRHIMLQISRKSDFLLEEQPLTLYNEDGTYSKEADFIFGPYPDSLQ